MFYVFIFNFISDLLTLMKCIFTYAKEEKIDGEYIGGMGLYAALALLYGKSELESFWIAKSIYFHPNFNIFIFFNDFPNNGYKKTISYHWFFLKKFLPELRANFVS